MDLIAESTILQQAATVCNLKIDNTPLTPVQLVLLMTNKQTGKLMYSIYTFTHLLNSFNTIQGIY